MGEWPDDTPAPPSVDADDGYASVLDRLLEGFQILDRRWRYLYVNDTVVAHARRPRHELLGQSLLDLYPGVEQTPMFAALERCMRTRTAEQFDNRFTYPDGEEAWFELRMQPVPEGLAVLSIDVTGRKRLEERVRCAQRLDAAGRMAAGLTHDFGNLLTAIAGACSLALSREPEPGVRLDLELALAATERATALVDQLLTFARQREVHPGRIDLRERVRGFAGLLRRSVDRRCSLALELGPTPAVFIDPGCFEQVLLNLVVNAADAMPAGGAITVRTGDVVFEREASFDGATLPPGRYAALTVKDVGMGMTPAVAQRIFEPFFTTKGENKGTGLGLSSSYGIVRQAGGAIAVCSEPGAGSTFTVYLPAAAGPTRSES